MQTMRHARHAALRAAVLATAALAAALCGIVPAQAAEGDGIAGYQSAQQALGSDQLRNTVSRFLVSARQPRTAPAADGGTVGTPGNAPAAVAAPPGFDLNKDPVPMFEISPEFVTGKTQATPQTALRLSYLASRVTASDGKHAAVLLAPKGNATTPAKRRSERRCRGLAASGHPGRGRRGRLRRARHSPGPYLHRAADPRLVPAHRRRHGRAAQRGSDHRPRRKARNHPRRLPEVGHRPLRRQDARLGIRPQGPGRMDTAASWRTSRSRSLLHPVNRRPSRPGSRSPRPRPQPQPWRRSPVRSSTRAAGELPPPADPAP